MSTSRRPFNDTLRLALLIRIYRYLRDNGEYPRNALIGRWYDVSAQTVAHQLGLLQEAGWVEVRSVSDWSLTSDGRARARREQSKRRTLFSEVLDTASEEGPGVVGFIDAEGLVRIWIGREAANALPESSYSFQLIYDVAPELVDLFEAVLLRGGPRSEPWKVSGRLFEAWMTRLDPDDPDQGVVLRIV